MIKFIKCLFLLVPFAFIVNAQQKTEFSKRPQPDPTIRNLNVGDQVPNVIISKIIRNDKSNAKLSDFKDQLLIIDFWDTFCGSCIDALPRLDTLQQQFGSRIKILPVSYQSEAVMSAFFKNNNFVNKRNVKLPCVVEDKLLGSYFPYKLISHEVWIYKGVVKAITGTDYITAKNIQTILDGKTVKWPVKNDMVNFDPKKPIFAQTEADQYNTTGHFLKYSGITGHREGIDYKKAIVYDTLATGYRSAFYNKSIVQAFTMMTFLLNPKTFILHPDRLILEVKDKSRYVYEKEKKFPSDWLSEHEICYEMVSAKPMDKKERLEYIYSDLQHLLGVNARWEKRDVNCLVIIKNKEVNIDSLNATRKTGKKVIVSGIPVFYLDQSEQYPPGIDETGIKGQIVIQDFSNLDGLKKQLQLYGCDIIEAKRNIDVMVITEK
ncbi:redoxin domain-containing protein [Pedobacter sp. PAMC26386]|nr:redoxin domain-containing protein [Pedobacter sp. PAMC26386]